jgi:TolB-like protein/Tfp pilus assembly protein PilF
MDLPSLFHRLKERKLFQWTVGYLAGAFVCLEAFDIVADQFGWALWIKQGVTVALLFGLAVTLVLAWQHGEKGRQEVSPGELILVALLLASTGVSLVALRGRSQDQARLQTAGLAFSFSRDTPHERSVAVLPCADRSQAGDQEYFADGLADELTTRLGAIHDLRVAARTSAFSFKGSDERIENIAGALNVRNVLQCGVRRDGDRVRITASLVDVEEGGFERWSASYDSDMEDLLALQAEMALAIAGALEAELAGDERSRLASRGTNSQEAYDLYLRGISHQWRQPWSRENQTRALDLFRAAVEADSTFAAAWALLATSYVSFGNFHVIPPAEAYSQAEIAANRAVSLDNDLAYAHWALGWVKFAYHYDWEGGEEEFRRTIALAPNDFTGYHSLTFPLSAFGKFDEAKAAAEEAISLDPLALWPRIGLTEIRFKMSDWESIIADAERSLAFAPNDIMALMDLALALAHKGSFDEAVPAALRAESMAPEEPHFVLMAANVLAMAGDTSGARDRLDKIEAAWQEGAPNISPGALASVYAHLGDADQTITYLNRSADTYDSWVYSLNYPFFRPFWGNPRFVELIDRLALPREAYR